MICALSPEANSRSASQVTSRLLWNSEFINGFTKAPNWNL